MEIVEKENAICTLNRVADRLTGIYYEDLTTAERQIVNILKTDYLTFDEENNVVEKVTNKEHAITTTNGEKFSYNQSRDLALSVYIRFGRDADTAANAWNRMMQTNCTTKEFMELVY